MPPKQQKKKVETAPPHVQKLLAALQTAQSKTSDTPSSSGTVAVPKTTVPKKTKPQPGPPTAQSSKAPPKQKKSVAARMQENVDQQQSTKRQRTTSKNTPVAAQSQQPQGYKGPKIPKDVLEELEFRFISNMPPSDKNNKIRICFQVELAHWFYIDHVHDLNERKDTPNIGIRDFFRVLFIHCHELRRFVKNVEEIIAEWREYKSTVPTYGAILLDESMQNVLLVQSYFAKGNSWGFPKGKVNQNEDPRDCAVRETLEETGFDFASISQNEKKLQKFINDTMVRLYIVRNTPKDFDFGPLTRKEIRKIEWFKINDLPTEKGESVPHLKGYNFFMVIPFVNDIRRYVEKELAKARKNVKNAEVPKIFSQLFPVTANVQKNVPGPSNEVFKSVPVLKRLTSEELFSTIRKSQEGSSQQTENISRPTLPDISPEVDGVDALATLGICTPLKPDNTMTQFPPPSAQGAPSESCPVIHEEPGNRVHYRRGLFQTGEGSGFEMPKDLDEPLLTKSWLDSQLVNTIMHPVSVAKSNSPATPPSAASNRSLSHLIGKPIQPQPILPQAASATAVGSAEAPKRSSRISLSDNSAFTAIPSNKQVSSSAKVTAPPMTYFRQRTDSTASRESRSSINRVADSAPIYHQQTPRYSHELFNLLTSPVSSGLRSGQGASRESLIELSQINKDVFSPSYIDHVSSVTPSSSYLIPFSNAWKRPIRIDIDHILGSQDAWERAFSIRI